MSSILLVSPYYDPNIVGGAEVSTQLIAEGLPGEADVLTFGLEDSVRTLNGVTVYEINIPEMSHFWLDGLNRSHLESKYEKARRLLRMFIPSRRVTATYQSFITNHGYETVLFNSNEDVFTRPSLWKAASASRARTVLVLRDPMLVQRKLPGFIQKAYRHTVRNQLRWVDIIASPSHYMINLHAHYGITKKDSHVIPNAVDTGAIAAVPCDRKNGVLYAGSLTKEKGIPTLVRAAGSFAHSEPLELIGRGALAEWCGAQEGVTIHDWMSREDLYQRMAAAKVFVLPSEWPEAFGRVLIEAVMSGTLVVGSDAGGIPEVLDHDERYVFRVGNADDLAAHVNRILSLSEQDYMRELESLQESFKRFSIDRYVNSWRELLENKRPGDFIGNEGDDSRG